MYLCTGLTSEPGGKDLRVCELECDYGPDLVVCKGDTAELRLRASGQRDQTDQQNNNVTEASPGTGVKNSINVIPQMH